MDGSDRLTQIKEDDYNLRCGGMESGIDRGYPVNQVILFVKAEQFEIVNIDFRDVSLDGVAVFPDAVAYFPLNI